MDILSSSIYRMEPWQLILLTGIGIIAGTLNVLAGGGSLLSLPVLVFLGLDGPVANGTNRVAILAQNTTAITGFRLRGFSDWKLSLSLALAALPGGIAGALLGTMVRGELFNRILGIILIAVLFYLTWQQWQKRRAFTAASTSGSKAETSPDGPDKPGGLTSRQLILGHLALVVVGFYGGFIQAGVGFLLMAALHQVMGLDLVRVNMHKVFIVAVFTLAALVVFAVKCQVLWVPGLALAVGNSVGGWIGSQISVLKGEVWIRRVLYATLLLMAVRLLAA